MTNLCCIPFISRLYTCTFVGYHTCHLGLVLLAFTCSIITFNNFKATGTLYMYVCTFISCLHVHFVHVYVYQIHKYIIGGESLDSCNKLILYRSLEALINTWHWYWWPCTTHISGDKLTFMIRTEVNDLDQ